MTRKKEISYFISPHGFGHATRSIAVIETLAEKIPDLHVRLLTTVPEILFKDLQVSWTYHPELVDVGLVQNDAFSPDLIRTVEILETFLPFSPKLVDSCCSICKSSEMIICDISPLGINVAEKLGVPSVLIENFTWDWIYSNLPESNALQEVIPYFQQQYRSATYRIQSEPLCRKAVNDLTCAPIARSARTGIKTTKNLLGCKGKSIILVTMGGIPHDLPFIDILTRFKKYFFILAGQKEYRRYKENILFLPFDTPLSHPDLIRASSLVVCKAGYSTIAECTQNCHSVCCVKRPGFSESEIIGTYVENQLNGTVIDYHLFQNGSWLDLIPDMIMPSTIPTIKNGACEVADFLTPILLQQ